VCWQRTDNNIGKLQWLQVLREPVFIPVESGRTLEKARMRTPSIVATNPESAQTGVVALALGKGRLNTLATIFPMFALGLRLLALKAQGRHPRFKWHASGAVQLGKVAINVISSIPPGKSMNVLEELQVSPSILAEIGGSFLGYVMDFMGGSTKLQMLLMWGVLDRHTDKLNSPSVSVSMSMESDAESWSTYLHSELSDACVATLGASFPEVWLSWQKFLDISRMHQRQELENNLNNLKELTSNWTEKLKKASLAFNNQENPDHIKELNKVTPLESWKWTIKWWWGEDKVTFIRVFLMLLYLGGWRMGEAIITVRIYAMAIAAETSRELNMMAFLLEISKLTFGTIMSYLATAQVSYSFYYYF
jgi:hypothetical protein